MTDTLAQPRLQMAVSNGPGVLFILVLLLVVVITNIYMRGMWSLIVILSILFLSILFATLRWWDPILRTFGVLDIHINSFGYLSIRDMRSRKLSRRLCWTNYGISVRLLQNA